MIDLTFAYALYGVQEHVAPPDCCPGEVRPLLSAAQACHQARQVDEALQLYAMAEDTWRQLVYQQEGELGELSAAALGVLVCCTLRAATCSTVVICHG